ncbi:MAG: hypothetical protein II840_06550 [Kiritimatiellae bacterium]|nr:hypothetical protein [Kiritimatiellia bacterium]
MATATRRGFGHIITKLAFASLLVAGFDVSAAATRVTVASGETATIGTDIGNNSDGGCELVAEAGSTVKLPETGGGNCWVYTRLYLTGSGTVTLVAPSGNFSASTVVFVWGIAAESDNVTLRVDIAGVTNLKVGRTRSVPTDINYPVADIANVTFANPNGIFGLRLWATARKLPAVFETGTLEGVALQGANPLHLADSLRLTSFDVVALTPDCIPANCTVTVDPGRTFAVKPCDTANSDNSSYTYKWFCGGKADWSGLYNVVLGGKGARVLCRNTNSLRLLANISGNGEVVFQPDGNSSKDTFFRGVTYSASQTSPLAVPICSATEPDLSTSWQGKVANWFDASETDSLVLLDYTPVPSDLSNSYTNGYPLLVGWKDKVSQTTRTYLFNRRFFALDNPSSDYVVQVLPYVVTNGLNGMDYVSMGAYGNKVSKPYAGTDNASESRRLQFHSASTSVTGHGKPTGGGYEEKSYPYCIMVFGSQQGGGKAILNDKSGTDLGNLARNSSSITHYWTAYDGYSMIVDGLDANPKTTKPNGGWQIVALDMTATNTVLIGISGHQNGSSSYGGMNYAEIIFFSEKPTPAERAACERYLAKKWGLETSYTPWDTDYTELSGTGTLTLDDSGWSSHEGQPEVTVAGNFAGTINVPADKTLVVSDRPAPPSPYDIPQQENIAAWFDPSFDGATDPHGNASAAAAGGIARLYSRTAGAVNTTDGSFYLAMQGSAPDSENARYPFLLETSYSGAHGIADTMKWLDFTVNATDDSLANNLRSHLMPAQDSHITESAVDKLPAVRSVFMSIDTSVGGGNPIADTVGMNGMFRPRNGTSAANPIWSTNNTVTMAHTWLDTNEVDGTTHGFNGRGEVLGFEMSEAKCMAVVLAYYNQGDRKNYEHIGETIIYSTTLSDAERLTVQEYLMAKWTGDMNGKYSDLSGATVTGAGNVKSAALRNLPKFDAGFTGTLSGGSNMTFTVDPSLNASAALDAITIDRAVTLDSVCTVTVTLKGKAKASTYTLLTVPSGSLAGKNFALNVVNETGRKVVAKLVTSDTTLSIETAPPPGFMLLIR